jgi:hypothetical protein
MHTCTKVVVILTEVCEQNKEDQPVYSSKMLQPLMALMICFKGPATAEAGLLQHQGQALSILWSFQISKLWCSKGLEGER